MTNVTVKFKVTPYPMQMDMVEVYPYNGYKGSQFDLDEELVMVDTTVDQLHGAELKKLEHKAAKLYLEALGRTVKHNWRKASIQQRKNVFKAYRWLNSNLTEDQIVDMVKARYDSLYNKYIVFKTIILYTE